MNLFPIDLYSDTRTLPTQAMLKHMLTAELGDEQHGEDPTVERLCRRTADLLGKQAAVFLPSGTMANAIAVLVSTERGDELMAHRSAHILNFEAGAAAALAGVMVRPLEGTRGMFDVETLSESLRRPARHLPRSRLVCIEQTTNLGGGAVWPLPLMRAVAELARDAGLSVHVDGARLMNAVVASGLPAATHAALADTVSLDFSKGLGAPFGAVLAGTSDVIERAWRWKQRLGGAMRQAGIMAAGCLYALDHHVLRLTEDHALAAALGDGLAAIPGMVVWPVETNMVFADLTATGVSAATFDRALHRVGARVSIQGPFLIRAVTHLGIDRDAIATVLSAAQTIIAEERTR